MTNSSASFLPSHVRRFAFLDKDAGAQVHPAPNVKVLPCTPEVGVVELVEEAAARGGKPLEALARCVPGATVNPMPIVSSPAYQGLNNPKVRQRSKERLKHFVSEVAVRTGQRPDEIRRTLYGVYCDLEYRNNIGGVKQLLGPVFGAR